MVSIQLSTVDAGLTEGRLQEIRLWFRHAPQSDTEDVRAGAMGGFESVPWSQTLGARYSMTFVTSHWYNPPAKPRLFFSIVESSMEEKVGFNSSPDCITDDDVGVVVIRGLDILFFSGVWAGGWPSLDDLILRCGGRRQMGSHSAGLFALWMNQATGKPESPASLQAILAAQLPYFPHTVTFRQMRIQALKLQ
jgi:hypothetical protein